MEFSVDWGEKMLGLLLIEYEGLSKKLNGGVLVDSKKKDEIMKTKETGNKCNNC